MDNIQSQTTALQIPLYSPIPDVALPPHARELLQQNYDELLSQFKANAEEEAKNNTTYHINSTRHHGRYEKLRAITSSTLDEIFAYLNGTAKMPVLDFGNDSQFLLRDNLFLLVLYQERLQELPECNLWHLLRAYCLEQPKQIERSLYSLFEEEILLQQADLRQIADILIQIINDDAKRYIAKAFLADFTLPTYHVYIVGKEDKIWPFFAVNQIYIDETLGLVSDNLNSQEHGYKAANALEILSLFPVIPTKYIPCLLALALGEGRRLRTLAQKVLGKVPDIHLEAEKALSSSKQEIRIAAANWLAELGKKSSVKILNEILAIEKKETVFASLLSSVSCLGEDVTGYLSPNRLRDDAKKGLKAKKPVSISWLEPNILPSLQWQNGEEVEMDIILWWIVLAVKLKQPAGNNLLQLYLGLLDSESQQKLGLFVLQMFIAQDTKTMSVSEATEKAQQLAPSELQEYKKMVKQHPEFFHKYENITLDEIVGQLKHNFLTEYLGSALEAKGMLALISHVDVYQAVAIVKAYMKNHSSRRSELSVILEAMASIYHPAIIQLLFSIAQRYQSNTIRKKAKQLINQIAESNDWTIDELAERAVPTAELDDSGRLEFDYGARVFTATLDNSLQLILKNPEGKIVKSLPEARKDENDEWAKSHKKQLATSKKELKQVIDTQTARLYEMMCVEQRWSHADWLTYLYQHPIMNRLIQKLIWLEVDDKQQIINSFRPTEDGCLINLNDDEITLNPNHQIMLAHTVYLLHEQVSLWLAHFTDYKVSPLFEQFANRLPDISHAIGNRLEDYYGQNIDSTTLQNRLNQRGYQPIDDWDQVGGYAKTFKTLGICACIMFSGYYKMSGQNHSVTLYHLHFTKRIGMRDKIMNIKDVPAVILAESFADYCALV